MPSPDRLRLKVFTSPDKHRSTVMFECLQRPCNCVLSPALRVGFGRVDQESVEGGFKVRDQIPQAEVTREHSRFGGEIVIAVAQGLAECSGSRSRRSAKRLERFYFLVKSLL